MPEYEIIEWNEENTDLSFSGFAQDAYANRKWAFVSDVVRLKVVYEYGGIYMDTDVELYDSLDSFLNDKQAFFFFQNQFQINTGMGFGAVKGSPIVKQMLNAYCEGVCFDLNQLRSLSCPVLNTSVIKRAIPEFSANGETQLHGRVLFLSAESYWRIANHYGEFSWATGEQKNALKYAKHCHKDTKLKRILRSPKLFDFFHKKGLAKCERIYAFFAYDFIDYGFKYWVVRIWQKAVNRIGWKG